jgi:hypothetical protein
MSFLQGRFPKTQFIVSAHGPLFVQAAADTNLVVLVEKGNQVEILRNPESIKGWRIDQVITSDLVGLDGARDPKTDKLLRRQEELLGKAELSESEQKELDKLDEQLRGLPTAETKEDRQAMALIRAAAAQLKKAANNAAK